MRCAKSLFFSLILLFFAAGCNGLPSVKFCYRDLETGKEICIEVDLDGDGKVEKYKLTKVDEEEDDGTPDD